MTRRTGTIKKWIPEKGYGFIDDGSGKDLFAHINSFVSREPMPKEGMSVQFIIGQQRGKTAALEVEVV